MVQKLSERLQAVAGFVTRGSRVADIGTDHGYLPVCLVGSGWCPQALAMDIRQGPLERAGEHIAASGLQERIRTRLSDGMEQLGADEADCVVIAGMGGLTMIHILESAENLLPCISELVLGPQSDIAKVRKFLRQRGMYTDRENLVLEGGKFYPVLHVIVKSGADPGHGVHASGTVRAGSPADHVTRSLQPEGAPVEGHDPVIEFMADRIPDPRRLQQVLDQYGVCLIRGRHPVLPQLLERDMEIKRRILQSLSAGSSGSSGERRRELERQLEEIRIVQEALAYA